MFQPIFLSPGCLCLYIHSSHSTPSCLLPYLILYILLTLKLQLANALHLTHPLQNTIFLHQVLLLMCLFLVSHSSERGKKLKIELPCDSPISLLGLYSKELKAGSQRDICPPMFIAALFTIVERRKQPESPLSDGWINIQWNMI